MQRRKSLFGVQGGGSSGCGGPGGGAECAGDGDDQPGEGEQGEAADGVDVHEAARGCAEVPRLPGLVADDGVHDGVLQCHPGGQGDDRGGDGGGDGQQVTMVMVCRGVIPTAL